MMRRISLALAFVGALVFSQGVFAQTKTIWFFTTSAKTFYGNSTAQMQAFAQQQVNNLNSASLQSAMSTTYATPTVSTSVCCGDPYMNGNPVNGRMLEQVMGNPKLMTERDTAGADVVVVVSNNGSGVDVAGRTLMDCTKTGRAAANKAIIGININQAPAGFSLVTDYMAALQCVTNETGAGTARAFTWMTGTDSTHCSVYTTAGSSTTPSSNITGTVAYTSEGGLAVTGYSTSDIDSANAIMASLCPNGNSGVYTYTCAVVNTCVGTGTPSPGTCYHTRSATDTRGPPICNAGVGTPNCTQTTGALATPATKTTFQCTSGTLFKLNVYSNPAQPFLGNPMGDSTHNAAAGADARNSSQTSTYHTFRISDALKAASVPD